MERGKDVVGKRWIGAINKKVLRKRLNEGYFKFRCAGESVFSRVSIGASSACPVIL